MALSSNHFIIAGVAILAYLIGAIPVGYLLVHLSLGKDVRTLGSGNIGATNVHRIAGGKAGMIVLLLDITKAFLAVSLAALLTRGDSAAVALAAVAVMIGHSYPVFLRFRGGKAVACFIGAFLYIAPYALFIALLVFIIAVALTKFISVGSIIAAVAFPFAVWGVQHSPPPVLIASIVASLLIVYRHKPNILRLCRGEEAVFCLRGGPAKGDSI